MSEYEYLTPEDFATAKANGISYNNAYHRYYVYGWDKQKAITVPVKKRKEGLWPKYKELAEQHGIKWYTFYDRIRDLGMTPEEAATTPMPPRTIYRRPNAKVNGEVIAIAAKNGISERTLKQRVYFYKWEVERAMTTPVDKSKGNKKGKKAHETTST